MYLAALVTCGPGDMVRLGALLGKPHDAIYIGALMLPFRTSASY
jgi:hypothetical protein